MLENQKSELETVLEDIKARAKTKSINKVDEVQVMKSMLNDKNFTLGVYDRNAGYVGQRCPHDEAVFFAKNLIAGATGLERKESEILASNYQFTKRDANFFLTNMRDFLNVYTGTGRKINVLQTANSEATLHTKEVGSVKKQVPDKENPGQSKEINTIPYTKLVSSTHCPKYKTE